MEAFSKIVRRLSQYTKRLTNENQSKYIQITVISFSSFLFTGCREYIATSVTLALIPEMLFGIFIAVVLILAILGAIIKLLSGGNRK